MLSQTAEHALRALLYLARQPGSEPVPAETIARAIGAPRNYLSKTLHELAKQGLVSGQRGPRGGFRLEVAPAELPLSRVVEAFEEPRPRGKCLLGGRDCDERTPCEAHRRWRSIQAASRAPLERTTLADLISEGVASSAPRPAA